MMEAVVDYLMANPVGRTIHFVEVFAGQGLIATCVREKGFESVAYDKEYCDDDTMNCRSLVGLLVLGYLLMAIRAHGAVHFSPQWRGSKIRQRFVAGAAGRITWNMTPASGRANAH